MFGPFNLYSSCLFTEGWPGWVGPVCNWFSAKPSERRATTQRQTNSND